MFTIHLTAGPLQNNDKNWMEKFIFENPGPLLRAGLDGKLLYANRASAPLLEKWKVIEGDQLPPKIVDTIRDAALQKRPKTLKLEAEDSIYSLTVTPFPEEMCANISCSYITSLKLTEAKLRLRNKQHETLFRLGKLALSSASLRTFLDEAAIMVAFTLEVESCKILKLSPAGDFLFQVEAGWKTMLGESNLLHRDIYSRAGCTLFSSKVPGGEDPEDGKSCLCPCSDFIEKDEFVSGISVTIGSRGRLYGVIAVHSTKKKEFTKEDVYFLNSVAAMFSGTIERRKVEKTLRDKVRFLETLLDTIPAPVFFKDRHGLYQGCNELFTRQVMGFPKEAIIGHSIEELSKAIPKDLGDVYKKMDRELLEKGGTQFYETKVVCADGVRRDFRFNKAAYRDLSDEVTGLVGVMLDITERKQAETRLQCSEERYRSFVQNFKGITFKQGLDFTPIFVHGAVEEITGYMPDDFYSGKVLWPCLVVPEDRHLIHENWDKLLKGPNLLFDQEYRIRRKDGKVRWVHGIIQNTCDSSGKIAFLQGSVYDITERKVAEEALVKVEEIRKKEIHHRVKNNLQIVSSLLFLQAEKFENDEEVIEAFRESEQRVISMSLIHEELYRSKDVEFLDFTAYLRKLTSDLLRSYQVGEPGVRLRLDMEDISFGIDTAIPLGIIINELFSNSLKYAFPEGINGEIYIGLWKEKSADNKNSEKSEVFTLTFSDNGVGFPKEIDIRKADTLGLQLVNALVDQLEGSLEIKRGAGTQFIIRFANQG